MIPLVIQEDALQRMQKHAASTFPEECCGFIFGEEKDGQRTVTQATEVDNSKEGDKRRRFEISPLTYLKAEQYAEKHGLTLLGVYHSHPQHPAIPSEHDLKQAVPFFSYPIISVQDGQIDHLRSWQLDDEGKFVEEKIGAVLI
jgi:proteasome lid subunit RPN8/RPN11